MEIRGISRVKMTIEFLANANDKEIAEQIVNNNVEVDCSTLKARQEDSIKTGNRLKSEPVPYPTLKIILIRLKCGNWAVKQKQICDVERSYKTGTVRIVGLSLSDARAVKRTEESERVKKALVQDKPPKTLRINPRCTNRLKALKRKATTLYAMKSRIMGKKINIKVQRLSL